MITRMLGAPRGALGSDGQLGGEDSADDFEFIAAARW